MQGPDGMEATGALLDGPRVLALLAAAYEKVGQGEEGLKRLEEALALVEQREIRWYEAGVHRLKGTLLLARSADAAEAEACFHQASTLPANSRRSRWNCGRR